MLRALRNCVNKDKRNAPHLRYHLTVYEGLYRLAVENVKLASSIAHMKFNGVIFIFRPILPVFQKNTVKHTAMFHGNYTVRNFSGVPPEISGLFLPRKLCDF